MGFIRKFLSAEGLMALTRHDFSKLVLPTFRKGSFSWADTLMSGLAIFSLKYPSLLAFDKASKTEGRVKRNLKNLFGVKKAPRDTTMRERLDTIEPQTLRRPFKTVFACLQKSKLLNRFKTLDGHYLLAIDGTGHFSSHSVHCENCCERHHKDGSVTYYHQMLGAAIVHPDEKIVIPMAPEMILKADGMEKNDCERNASKRFLTEFRREHPHLKVIVVEDALSSNFPHLSLLDSLNFQYIIGVKPKDHVHLFDFLKHVKSEKFMIKDRNGNTGFYKITHNVPLNETHDDYWVTVVEYQEKKKDGTMGSCFSWVTRLEINQKNAEEFMRAGRGRWKIENETFNTLKNQGYEFEHNFGHGNKNLCSVLGMLMLLAFLIDQAQSLASEKYQKAVKKIGATYLFHQTFKILITYFDFETWDELFDLMINPETKRNSEIRAPTSQ